MWPIAQGVWGIRVNGVQGVMGYRCMGHMGNGCTGGHVVQEVWGTGAEVV